MAENPSIYRSKHPDVWAAIEAWKASEKRFHADVAAFSAKYGMADHTPLATAGFGSKTFTGYNPNDGEWRNPPKHWRSLTKRGGYLSLVPYRNKAKGDPAMVADFDAVERVADVRGEWPGMPQYTGLFRSPGAHADDRDEFMYVDWGDGHGPEAGQVDLGIWEPVLRSEYHRLKESGEFAHLDADAEQVA